MREPTPTSMSVGKSRICSLYQLLEDEQSVGQAEIRAGGQNGRTHVPCACRTYALPWSPKLPSRRRTAISLPHRRSVGTLRFLSSRARSRLSTRSAELQKRTKARELPKIGLLLLRRRPGRHPAVINPKNAPKRTMHMVAVARYVRSRVTEGTESSIPTIQRR